MASTRLREKVRGAVDEEVDAPDRWWNAKADGLNKVTEAGTKLHAYLAAIEIGQSRQRFMNYVARLLMYGRAPASFGFSMSAQSSREHVAMSQAIFRPPSLNCIASVGDTLKERVWSRVSWLEWLPIQKNDYDQTERCKQTTQWWQAFAEATDLEALISEAGECAACDGTSFVRTTPSRDGKAVVNSLVLDDEMRISHDANLGKPTHHGQVAFEHREDLINVHAVGKDKAAVRTAILRAPAAHRGFTEFSGEYRDIVCVAEGFRYDLPDGTPGRHVLALADGFTLVDEEWHDDPYSVLRYNRLSRSYRGKGVPENCIAMQMELDRMVSCRAEAQRQASYPHVQIERGAHIDPNSVEGAGVIEYTGTPARFDIISGTPKDLDATIAEMARLIFKREGISENTAGGDLPANVDAGVAIDAFQNIADARLYSHAKNLEHLLEDVGGRNMKCATVVKPSIRVGAKTISWGSVSADLKKAKYRAFPLSKLPSSLPGQLKQVELWYKGGQINGEQRARLLQMPDPTGQLPMITASENCTLQQLGEIRATGEYQAPDSMADPLQSYETARAFYLVSRNEKLDSKRLQQIVKFVKACEAAVKAATPAPAPPAAMPGAQPTPGGIPQ